MPIRPLLLLVGLAVVSPAAASAQGARIRTAAQVADSLDIADLTHRLTAAVNSDSARAAAIYEWVAGNVAWDVSAYLAGVAVFESAEDVYRRRIALCGGYVALYARMAREAGLEVEAIEGYAKGFDYTNGRSTKDNNHAWLAVRIGGTWRLVDPTWGSGHVVAGRFVRSFNWDYFLIAADELILSHFPEKSRWQLVSQPMRRQEFERMPAVPRALFDVGFAPAAVRNTVLSAGVRDFPLVGQPGRDVQVVHAPIGGTLRTNALVELDVIWPGATSVAMVSGQTWTHLQRSGDRFHGAAPAGADAVFVVGLTAAAAPGAYTTLLHYTVR
jgi:hypothetical protein